MTTDSDLISRKAALEAIQDLRHAAACNFTPRYMGNEGQGRCDSFYEAYEAVRKMEPAALASTAGAGAGDWVTVPRKITMPMGMKFYEHRARDEDAQFCWEAMIEAAPAVPASPRSGAGERGEDTLRILRGLEQELGTSGTTETFRKVLALAKEAAARARAELASPPAPAEHGAEIREARSRWLDWRGAVEGIERSKEIAAQAVRQVRENGGDDTNQDVADNVCWMLGLDHLWQHVEALRAALAAKQAPDVATALRREADRLIAKADDLTAALSQGGGAGRSEKGEGEGRDGLPENWPEVLIRRGVWGRGGEYTKARDTEGTSDLLVQTATMLSADRERRRAGGFQARVIAQMHRICEGDPTDLAERRDRHAEEDAELLQSLGLTREAHHRIVDYVHDRPVGEPDQEMGGTMHTLAGLAAMAGLDMMACGEREFARVDSPEVTAKIRRKRSNRHGRGPLPGNDAGLNTAIAPAQSPSTSDAEG